MILMSFLNAIFFFGGWLPLWPFGYIIGEGVFWLIAKTIFFMFCFIWARAAFPRYRYDQLMRLGWKIFLPLSLGWLIFTSSVLVGFDNLPPIS